MCPIHGVMREDADVNKWVRVGRIDGVVRTHEYRVLLALA